MFIVVLLHGTMSGLVLKPAVWRNQYRSHHGQRAKGRGHHVGHNVTIVVLTGPEHTAFGFHDTGHGIIDEGEVELDPGLFELVSVLLLKGLRKDVTEGPVVGLRDGVLCTEPKVHLLVQCIFHAGLRKAADRRIGVVNALDDSAAFVELLNRAAEELTTRVVGVNKLRFSGTGHLEFGVLVYISVSVPPHDDGLSP